MTQTRPEACTCRDKPVWCDPCLESGYSLIDYPGLCEQLAMPVPSRTAWLQAENVRLVTENAALHATVAHLTDQQHANEPAPPPPGIPAHALRQRHQAIGLLSTADAGRVRLGGYAPTLPR